MESKKQYKRIYVQNGNRLTEMVNKLMVTKGECKWRKISQEYGINRYKVLYIKQISNNDLVYSTGNNIHYSLVNYNGK